MKTAVYVCNNTGAHRPRGGGGQTGLPPPPQEVFIFCNNYVFKQKTEYELQFVSAERDR